MPFAVGALGESLAPGTWTMVISRFVVGFGVGIASVAGPLYAAEMAPSSTRGRYVSSYQLAVTIGILLADIADAVLSGRGNWRVMPGLSIVPDTLLVVVALSCRTRPGGTWPAAGAQTPEPASPRPGIGLAVFQQVTGINAVICHSGKIFKVAGFTTPHDQTIATIVSVGVVNCLATLIALAWIDKFGRKPLLYAGLIGMMDPPGFLGGHDLWEGWGSWCPGSRIPLSCGNGL